MTAEFCLLIRAIALPPPLRAFPNCRSEYGPPFDCLPAILFRFLCLFANNGFFFVIRSCSDFHAPYREFIFLFSCHRFCFVSIRTGRSARSCCDEICKFPNSPSPPAPPSPRRRFVALLIFPFLCSIPSTPVQFFPLRRCALGGSPTHYRKLISERTSGIGKLLARSPFLLFEPFSTARLYCQLRPFDAAFALTNTSPVSYPSSGPDEVLCFPPFALFFVKPS